MYVVGTVRNATFPFQVRRVVLPLQGPTEGTGAGRGQNILEEMRDTERTKTGQRRGRKTVVQMYFSHLLLFFSESTIGIPALDPLGKVRKEVARVAIAAVAAAARVAPGVAAAAPVAPGAAARAAPRPFRRPRSPRRRPRKTTTTEGGRIFFSPLSSLPARVSSAYKKVRRKMHTHIT